MEEYISLYSPDDLIPILESLNNINESIKVTLQEIVKSRVYTEWLIGLDVAIFVILIIIVFSIFFANYGR